MCTNSSQVPSGYDYPFLCDDLEDLMCVVCRFVAKNPHQVNCCGKIICHSCLQYWQQTCRNPNTCPHCKQRVQCFEDKKCHQKIISLRVRCSYNQYGCRWEGELKIFEESHYHRCLYQVKKCTDCGEDVPKQKMKDHVLNECKKRSTKCPHCPCVNTYEYVYGKHRLACQFWPVECPSGCGQKVLRSTVEEHRKTCQLQLVQCRYVINGCQVMATRQEIHSHEEECPKKLTGNFPLTNGQQQMMESNEKGTVAPIMVQFKDYEQLKEEKKVWESQPFYCFEEGYRICLMVHPYGCISGEGSHLSCYIHLHSGHFDEKQAWPFRGVVTVSLRNQAEDVNHFTREINFTTNHYDAVNRMPEKDSVNPFGRGESQFIKQSDLVNYGKNIVYLKDDRLVFEIRYAYPKHHPYNCLISSNAR